MGYSWGIVDDIQTALSSAKELGKYIGKYVTEKVVDIVLGVAVLKIKELFSQSDIGKKLLKKIDKDKTDLDRELNTCAIGVGSKDGLCGTKGTGSTLQQAYIDYYTSDGYVNYYGTSNTSTISSEYTEFIRNDPQYSGYYRTVISADKLYNTIATINTISDLAGVASNWITNTSYEYNMIDSSNYSVTVNRSILGENINFTQNHLVSITDNAFAIDFSIEDNSNYLSTLLSNNTGTLSEAMLEIYEETYNESFGRPADMKNSNIASGVGSGIKFEMNAHYIVYEIFDNSILDSNSVIKNVKDYFVNRAYEANMGKRDHIFNLWRHDN